MSLTAHIINHTHWDREWFLTSPYTSAWIPELIYNIAHIVEKNHTYQFFFDGQTLVMEDLLKVDTKAFALARRMIRAGNLQIGPYYVQPDWKLTSGELLCRNLTLGQDDARKLGGVPPAVGWMVDIFGHISQSPQIHALHGITGVYVWRGVPELTPFFSWYGADGTQIFACNLFSGYRNLYGVTKYPEVAQLRLRSEQQKLKPLYPTPHIPLFDGYDLDKAPEDPVKFFSEQPPNSMIPNLNLVNSTPEKYLEVVTSQTLPVLPKIRGELLSGKYSSVFTGTPSSRIYLKIMQFETEQLLTRYAEPLAHLAAHNSTQHRSLRWSEQATRLLLQTAVHDCICGVSMELVHDKCEYIYRSLHRRLKKKVTSALNQCASELKPGTYCFSPNPSGDNYWHETPLGLAKSVARGLGLYQTQQIVPITKCYRSDIPAWSNKFYQNAIVLPDGTVSVGRKRLGRLVIRGDRGDTYSEEWDGRVGQVKILKPARLLRASKHHQVVSYHAELRLGNDVLQKARVEIKFSKNPLIEWQIHLSPGSGQDFRISVDFDTGSQGEVVAGMQFDAVKRLAVDTDLLSSQLPKNLRAILLAQRELNSITTFPFHEYVALSKKRGKDDTVLARGLHSYQCLDQRTISLDLRRSVCWLAKTDLQNRIGDAGPVIYVPGALCRRREIHQVAFGSFQSVDSTNFLNTNASYQVPPIFFTVHSSSIGKNSNLELFQTIVPFSGLVHSEEGVWARLYNPLSTSITTFAEGSGTTTQKKSAIKPKQIQLLPISLLQQHRKTVSRQAEKQPSTVTTMIASTLPSLRMGGDGHLTDVNTLVTMTRRVDELQAQVEQICQKENKAHGITQYQIRYQRYILERELFEMRLAIYVAQYRNNKQNRLTKSDLFTVDQEIKEIGEKLAELRINRRIFDYVMCSLEAKPGLFKHLKVD